MPPSLEPMEDFGHWTPATAPFPESYARAIAEDEPPPDAGLADLLARALAEHQAGTASAAALVKQLGSEDNGGRRNGHGRNGHGAEVPDTHAARLVRLTRSAPTSNTATIAGFVSAAAANAVHSVRHRLSSPTHAAARESGMRRTSLSVTGRHRSPSGSGPSVARVC